MVAAHVNRARQLALSLLELGETPADTTAQLLRWRIDPHDADNAVAWAQRHRNMPNTYTFLVTVTTDTLDHAEQVMSERIGPDEDYGFDYRIDWSNVS